MKMTAASPTGITEIYTEHKLKSGFLKPCVEYNIQPQINEYEIRQSIKA